jgi:UDP-N-acetylmuramoyl-L-alanyl-D-glutamate--2,6-diaminopimelate ligase
MRFSDLLYGAEVLSLSGEAEVSGVQYDSRKVKVGDCFVAIRGETTDGNRYIDVAMKSGAVAIISDSKTEKPRNNAAWAQVPNGRRALAVVSANVLGRPAERLGIVGVTGTNGKTTTTFLVEAMLREAGRTAALLGTIEYRIGKNVVPAPHTTPESLELNEFFARALKEGATDAAMEVSSHALEQERVYAIPFDVAVFTNLTRDHLDYHKDMESYFASKAKLFQGVGTQPPRVAILNKDDEYGRRLIDAKRHGSQTFTYGLASGDFHATKAEIMLTGTRFDLVTPDGPIEIFSPLVGRVNVYNILAASAAAWARGCSLDAIRRAVLCLQNVPGRFQRVDAGQPFTVVVDYAHTDDALRNLTTLARELVNQAGSKGRVITVFGCGGDRDRAKRPLMGKAAGEGSDFAVLTSDNPRSESPLAIIHDALVGLATTKAEYTIEPDRERAIRLAMMLARPGDIVLLAGKGHEKMQVTAKGTLPFDDVEVGRRALYAAGYTEDFMRPDSQVELARGQQ